MIAFHGFILRHNAYALNKTKAPALKCNTHLNTGASLDRHFAAIS